MPRNGRPPTPTEQKRRAGNPGKRPLPDQRNVVLLPAAEGVPDPLADLAEPGLRLWHRVWHAGAHWLSPTTDAELVQLVCEMADERAGLRALVLAEGDWRQRVQLRALDKQIVDGLSLLGMTPTDRARLGVAEVVAASKLEQLKAARRA